MDETPPSKKLDTNRYMREYMRLWRKGLKGKKNANKVKSTEEPNKEP